VDRVDPARSVACEHQLLRGRHARVVVRNKHPLRRYSRRATREEPRGRAVVQNEPDQVVKAGWVRESLSIEPYSRQTW